ncbi:MAG: transglycosylase domain-containing protein [Propionicimonas sp.]
MSRADRAAAKADEPNWAVTMDDLLECGFTPDVGPAPSQARRAVPAFLAATLALGLVGAGIAAPLVTTGGATMKMAATFYNDLPVTLPAQPLPQRSVILASDGTKIAEFYSENRVLVPLAQVALVARHAIVAIEDTRFYTHHGIDIRGTGRALLKTSTGASRQGGSTLTQQYIKNVLLNDAATTNDKAAATAISLERKIREAKLAVNLEKRLSKDQILEGYLNIAYFGDGAYGVGTAAQHYFSVPAAKLTLTQAATIAGLVQNPDGYNPAQHPLAATRRRNTVLARMRDLGYITAKVAAAAEATPLGLKVKEAANGCTTSKYPFYCQWVRNTLATNPVFGKTVKARENFLFRGGLTIHTALDPRVQDAAQTEVDAALGRNNRVAAGVAVIQPGTGRVVAMAQNRTFGAGPNQTEIILPAQKAFQPGSTFKAVTLAAALENGVPPTATMNAPGRYQPPGGHFPGQGFTNSAPWDSGNLTLSQATARSSNTFFVKLENQQGVLNVADMAGRLGMSLPRSGPSAITEMDASMTLGTYEVSPLEMATVYATFAAHGVTCNPTGITAITGPTGAPAPAPDPHCHQGVAAGVADTVASLLQGVVDGPDPYRTGKRLSIGRPVAGKTGTTDNASAVWFNGFTPQYETAVWVGDPRGGFKYPLSSVRLYGRTISSVQGATAAGPIWSNIMKAIHVGQPKVGFTPVDANQANAITNIIPDVRGLGRDKAIQTLQEAGLDVTVAKAVAAQNNLTPANYVAAQHPAPGSLTPPTGTVTLTLTAGSDVNVTIPARTGARASIKPATPTGITDTGGGITALPANPTKPLNMLGVIR